MATSTHPAYLPRLIDPQIEALLAELPAVLLVGPRAAGKTTTAQRFARSIVRLDREADAVAFRSDPDAALRGLDEPVLLDEWQAVPGVLGAVKRAVDTQPRPGRFLLTGSVRADLEAETWPGTGRLVRRTLFGLTVRELQEGTGRPSILARILERGADAVLDLRLDAPDLHGYLELVLRSGFPEPALRLGAAAREAWLDGYLEQLLTRDVELVEGGRDPDRLRRYLTGYATVTAQVVEDKTISEAAGINRRTALAYEQLLKNLFVIDAIPAWSTNRLKQLIRGPKRHVVDPALAATALRLDHAGILRGGPLLGAMFESFVAAQVRAELAAAPLRRRLLHLRTQGGRHEVDLLIEADGDRIVAIEVKTSAAPREEDARHLAWLRDAIGERFAAGLLLHTGPRAWSLGPRIAAAPIAALWS